MTVFVKSRHMINSEECVNISAGLVGKPDKEMRVKCAEMGKHRGRGTQRESGKTSWRRESLS